MITYPKVIYKRVAEKNNLKQELVESIGTIVFQQLRASLNDPRDLAYELPGLGTFNVRFSRFESYFNYIKNNKPEEHETENYLRAERLCEMMKQFRIDKETKRKKRYDEIEANQSSEDNPA